MHTSNKTIAKNTLFLYARMLIVMAVTLYTSRMILEILGVSDYGLYNVVGGIVTMLSFVNGALSVSTSRFFTYELGKRNKEKLKQTFSASLRLHFLFALLVLFLGETVGLWFFYEKLVIPADRLQAAFWVYQFSILTTMVSFTQVPYNASLIAHENMSIYAYVGLYEAFSRLLIVFLLQISPIDQLVCYSFLLMLNNIGIQFFYRFYTSNKYAECRFRIIRDKKLYNSLLRYSVWDLFGNIAAVCQGQGINILLNMFFGPVVNAARAITFQIQNALGLFISSFLTAVRPQVVKSFANGNSAEMYRLTFNAAKYSYLLMFTLMFPLCLELDYVLHLWLGNNVPADTYRFTIIVLVTYLMQTFHSAYLMSYHAIGRIKTGNIVGGLLMISALPISYVCLKCRFPAYSVFIVIFIVNFIQMFFGWWLIRGYVRFRWMDLIHITYCPCVFITLLAVFFPVWIHQVMPVGFVRLVAISVTNFLIVSVLTYFIALDSSDRQKVSLFIKNKIERK